MKPDFHDQKEKRKNILPFFSVVLAVTPFVLAFILEFSDIPQNVGCGDRLTRLLQPMSFCAVVVGVVSLLLIKYRRQKGKWLAIIGIAIGLLGTVIFVPVC